MTITRLVQALIIAVAGLVPFAAPPSFADDATPLGLLKDIYQRYERSDEAVDIGSQEKAARYFTAEVAALIARDIKESSERNEVGRLDFDPFTGGQDWQPTKIDLKVAKGADPAQALGSATFRPAGEKKRTTVKLDLVKTPPGWRVADIRWEGQSDSLVAILKRKD